MTFTDPELDRFFADIRAKRGQQATPQTNGADHELPELRIDANDLPAAARQLRDLFVKTGTFFFNGNAPVRVVQEAGWSPKAIELNAEAVIVWAHGVCQPKRKDGHGGWVNCTLPKSVAMLYLNGLEGEWGLPALKGISCAPLLNNDGSIRSAEGYDPATGLWCHSIPTVSVLECPTIDDAQAALRIIRETFKTFCFADAATISASQLGINVVNLNEPAGLDESSYYSCLMGAVCRPSLPFCPGSLGIAADISGAGVGKGKLVRAAACIAHGDVRPEAITKGHSTEELEKRLTTSLIEASPVVFLDNVNRDAIQSNTLASILTEDPAKVRVMGTSSNVPLNTKAWIAVTGNALQVSEDLARRFIMWVLDAKMENPETRPFRGDFLAEIAQRRGELLAAVLTIWRWGRQNEEILTNGIALGGFETWCSWVRDPLLTLGCADPVARLSEMKANDPHRQHVAEVFDAWWDKHGSAPIRVSELNAEVQVLIDPKMSRRRIEKSLPVGTRVAGFALERHKASKRAAAIYRLISTEPREDS